jgi:hypothetical protein
VKKFFKDIVPFIRNLPYEKIASVGFKLVKGIAEGIYSLVKEGDTWLAKWLIKETKILVPKVWNYVKSLVSEVSHDAIVLLDSAGRDVLKWATKEAITFKNYIITRFEDIVGNIHKKIELLIPTWHQLETGFKKLTNGSLIVTIGDAIKNMFVGLIEKVKKDINPLNWFGSKSSFHKTSYDTMGAGSGFNRSFASMIHQAAYTSSAGNQFNYSPYSGGSTIPQGSPGAYNPKPFAVSPTSVASNQRRNVELIKKYARAANIPTSLALGWSHEESSWNSSAHNPVSSAYGLFQVTNGTWNEYAKKLGIANTPENRANPAYEAQVGAAYLKDTIGIIHKNGFKANQALAYLGGFGSGFLSKFLRYEKRDPDAIAASVFPNIVSENRPLFYTDGKALTIEQVYEKAVERMARLGYNKRAGKFNPVSPFTPSPRTTMMTQNNTMPAPPPSNTRPVMTPDISPHEGIPMIAGPHPLWT